MNPPARPAIVRRDRSTVERWNPWDSLGEALAEVGRVEEAIAA